MFTHTDDQKLIIHDFKISENKEKLVLQRNLRNQKLQSKVNNNLFIYHVTIFWGIFDDDDDDIDDYRCS